MWPELHACGFGDLALDEHAAKRLFETCFRSAVSSLTESGMARSSSNGGPEVAACVAGRDVLAQSSSMSCCDNPRRRWKRRGRRFVSSDDHGFQSWVFSGDLEPLRKPSGIAGGSRGGRRRS
jgi:hypothetical protein